MNMQEYYNLSRIARDWGIQVAGRTADTTYYYLPVQRANGKVGFVRAIQGRRGIYNFFPVEFKY